MKKIVALVLAMVMVLGLATTAFAATPANYYAASNLSTALGTEAGMAYSLEPYTTGSETAKTFDQVAIWKTNIVNGAKALVDTYVVAASADSADYAFVDGSKITYLQSYAASTTWSVVVTKVPTVKYADCENCGEMFSYGNKAVYADAAGNLYVEDGTAVNGNVDGKFVSLKPAVKKYLEVADIATATGVSGDVWTVIHTYDFDYKTYGSDKTVTRVFCEECDAEFAFVEGTVADAIAKFGAGNYTVADTGVYVSLAPIGAVADTPAADGEKVESAETFDAGIAMYVGMSVMAAAGSAVVLKKKD